MLILSVYLNFDIKVLALKCLVAEEFSSLGLISIKLSLSYIQNTSLVLN